MGDLRMPARDSRDESQARIGQGHDHGGTRTCVYAVRMDGGAERRCVKLPRHLRRTKTGAATCWKVGDMEHR